MLPRTVRTRLKHLSNEPYPSSMSIDAMPSSCSSEYSGYANELRITLLCLRLGATRTKAVRG